MTEQGMPDDITYLGDAIKAGAHSSSAILERIYNALRRQENPNPTVINLNPGVVFSTTTRMRTYALIFTGGTASELFGLRVGAAISLDWYVPASPGVFTIPIPLVFDTGVDVRVVDQTTPIAVNWTCRVFAFTEAEDD